MNIILFDGDDIQRLDKLCQEPGYLDAPFLNCQACREDRLHTVLVWPLWANALLSVSSIGMIALLDSLGHAWLGILLCTGLMLLVWYLIRPFCFAAQEHKARRLAHAQLDKGLNPNQRRARAVHLVVFTAPFRFVGPGGYLTLAIAEIDRFLRSAQELQYRLRASERPRQELHDLFGVIARTRHRRRKIEAFGSQTTSYLAHLKKDAEKLELAYSETGDCKTVLGPLHDYFYLFLYSHLKFYEQSVQQALERSRIQGLTARCFDADPPDIAGLEKSLDDFLDGLPNLSVVSSPDPSH